MFCNPNTPRVKGLVLQRPHPKHLSSLTSALASKRAAEADGNNPASPGYPEGTTCLSKGGDLIVRLLISSSIHFISAHIDFLAPPSPPLVRHWRDSGRGVSGCQSPRRPVSCLRAGQGFAPAPSITGVFSAQMSLNVYRPLLGGGHHGFWPLTSGGLDI